MPPGRSRIRTGITIILWIAVAAAFVRLIAPFGRGVESEFSNLPGRQAIDRLHSGWPADLDPRKVDEVSWKYSGTIDSHSKWFKIVLSPDAATIWQDEAHRRQEQSSRESVQSSRDLLEGVHRVERGPPTLRRQTGKTPAWWAPPAIDFRVTESMRWHGSDWGYGRATWSGYDEPTRTLWIYDDGRQRDDLWLRGKVPAGQQFSASRDADEQETGN